MSLPLAAAAARRHVGDLHGLTAAVVSTNAAISSAQRVPLFTIEVVGVGPQGAAIPLDSLGSFASGSGIAATIRVLFDAMAREREGLTDIGANIGATVRVLRESVGVDLESLLAALRDARPAGR